ncbi:MAG TPA: RNA-binding protein [Candidatus Parabacteroides intestinigallinarum]|uniref:RNA-binding protein n=1 Tax=Candidatus Parabacteroides intestinigallinarum TaxID=2838722 RepID=A0A9D2BQ30_9BACT|nr:RNA-binding protein [Candidatus Parabacteroides intestinigallinarum]
MGAAGNKKPKKPGKKHGPSYMEEDHEVPLKSVKKKTGK